MAERVQDLSVPLVIGAVAGACALFVAIACSAMGYPLFTVHYYFSSTVFNVISAGAFALFLVAVVAALPIALDGFDNLRKKKLFHAYISAGCFLTLIGPVAAGLYFSNQSIDKRSYDVKSDFSVVQNTRYTKATGWSTASGDIDVLTLFSIQPFQSHRPLSLHESKHRNVFIFKPEHEFSFHLCQLPLGYEKVKDVPPGSLCPVIKEINVNAN